MKHYLAFDLGAESGRAILGTLADGKLTLEELHRFLNTPVQIPAGLYWDTFRLFHEIREGLALAGRERRIKPSGIAIDTWGVDFALLASDGSLIDNPRHYRDARTNGMLERTFAVVPREEIFAETGLQFMQLNSLYQLYAAKLEGSPNLSAASTLLFMPDLFNYWLTGVQCAEVTIASTSQFYNPVTGAWATRIFERLGLPVHILPRIVPSGERLGELLPAVAEYAALPGTPVFTTGCHDTASAVAAVPARGDDWCYISSGTWSLMGVETAQPIISPQVLAATLTNEVGAQGTIRLLKNIAGLWLIQECRRAWAIEGHEYSYEELARRAGAAPPFTALINPDVFLHPGRMPDKIADYCRATGQKVPSQPDQMCRTIFESLALRYRQVLEGIEAVLGRRLNVIHIVGGGSRNHTLNQFVADATSRTVIAGPAEATAAGNILIQAMGAGEFTGLGELREVVRASFPLTVVEPSRQSDWDPAYERFCGLTQKAGGS